MCRTLFRRSDLGRCLLAAMVTVVLMAGCMPPQETVPPSPESSPTAPGAPTQEPSSGIGFMASAVLVGEAGFGEYAPVEAMLPESHEGYTLPLNLDDVPNLELAGLGPAQQELLAENGFVVVPSDYREYYTLYQGLHNQQRPLFVTTDSVLHVYHLLFDKVLRTAEEAHFNADLVKLTRGMLWASQAQLDALEGTALEEAAQRNVAYFAVALQLLDPAAEAPDEVNQQVTQELALIEAHEGFATSSIIPGYEEDYSQYVPRGHYSVNETRQRYFKAMMWYGRINFRLKELEETRSAVLIAQALSRVEIDGEPAAQLWERVYEPTVFFVGATDDLNIRDYQKLMEQVYGSVPEDPAAFADDALLSSFVAAARELPPPQINSMWVWVGEDREEETQGFRLMGQRFVIDAYIFQQLIYSKVDDRYLPKGLDVFSAMGSEEAYELLDEMGETQYPKYIEQMEKLRGEIAALEMDTWTQNLYWTWLHSLRAIIEPKDERYPAFMRTRVWAHKDLHTALGSWTELKHDTILYAKQAYAELTAMPPQSATRGYVEPNPEAYARLLALTRMTREGLDQRGLLSSDDRDSLDQLEQLLDSLKTIAEKELQGETLTDSEYELINNYGDWLEGLTIMAADTPELGGSVDEHDAALVADVATDPNSGSVLEEGVGRINQIFVVAEVNGQLSLTQGGVFSYYEFPWPMSDRLTDEAWRELLDSGQGPTRPEWTSSFVSP
jgi:hypothetical protein